MGAGGGGESHVLGKCPRLPALGMREFQGYKIQKSARLVSDGVRSLFERRGSERLISV